MDDYRYYKLQVLRKICLSGLLGCLIWPSPALAQVSCSAANQYSFDFNSQPTQTLNYANNYNYTATRAAGGTVNVNVSFSTFGLASSIVAGRQMPEISNLISGAPTQRSLVIGAIFTGRTANIAVNNRIVATTFTFSQPVRELNIFTHDTDFNFNQFRDYVQVLGFNGASTYTGVLTTPQTNNNQGGPLTAVGSSVKFGPTATPVALTVDQAQGTSASGNNANTGNINVLFNQPVTSVEIRYGNAPLTAGETNTGQQAIGITRLNFCPLPDISIAKTSAPVDISGVNRFNVPNADVDYTLTVTNNGDSTVDLNSTILADILPDDVEFFNGDIDAGTAGTQNFVFTPNSSGLTLGSGNITYSDNGGSSYIYGPSAGYDANVDAVRFAPQGTMAANSSFTIRFRTRIK